MRAPDGLTGGAGRATPMGGDGAGPWGRGNPWERGWEGDSAEMPRSPREGRGRLRPKARHENRTGWAPRQEGRMQRVECEFRGPLPSLPSGQV